MSAREGHRARAFKLALLLQFLFQLSSCSACDWQDSSAYTAVLILQFVDIGIVTSIEINHKQVDVAKKGQEVCVKIEPIPGESPKMYGRHFEATDILVSKVSVFLKVAHFRKGVGKRGVVNSSLATFMH